MLEKLEFACKIVNGTTIKDSVYPPMYSLKEIERLIGFEVKEGWTKIDEYNYLQIELVVKENSTWIYMDIYDKEDYEYIVNEVTEEDMSEEEVNEIIG